MLMQSVIQQNKFPQSWSFPDQDFESWAVWQNENLSVAAKPGTSQQGVTLKSCSNNIKADLAPLINIPSMIEFNHC